MFIRFQLGTEAITDQFFGLEGHVFQRGRRLNHFNAFKLCVQIALVTVVILYMTYYV